MLIHRDAAGWDILVPAKVNLFLEVLGKRADGYHDLDTVMLAVSLCDRLRLRRCEHQELRLRVLPASTAGFAKLSIDDKAWEIPSDHSNLVIRALELVRQRFGVTRGLEVDLIKGIPAQAGLGGGSADAAAAIIGGMLSWLGTVHLREAVELASGLGSDINFFIEGRSAGGDIGNWLARCSGRGEKVQPLSSDWMLDLVVVHPPLGCATNDVFRRLAGLRSSEEAPVSGDDFVRSLEKRNRNVLAKILFNRLGPPAAAGNPWIERLQTILRDEPSALGRCVSGSGSAVIAVTETTDKANQLAEKLRTQYPVRAYAVRCWQSMSISEQISTMNS